MVICTLNGHGEVKGALLALISESYNVPFLIITVRLPETINIIPSDHQLQA